MAEREYRPEKRGNVRSPMRVPARLSFGAEATIEGLTRDVSAGGAYLVAGGQLLAQVTIGEGEAQRTVPVRVVRLEPLPGGGFGIGIQFVERE